MKHIYIILIIILTITGCGLTDVLDNEPPNNLVPENVVNDVSGAENLLNGAYATLNEQGYYLHTEYTPGLLSGSMEIRTTIGDAQLEQNAVETDNSVTLPTLWGVFYEMINAANNVIDLVPELDDNLFLNGRKEEIIGEAHFLRAMAHFDALRYFGQFYDLNSALGVITRTEPSDFVTRNLGRSSVRDVYELIIEDLDVAINQSPDLTVPYYSSKTSAKALKARVRLYMGEYAEAAVLADEVIEEGLVSLSSTFADVFDDGITSDEMIFMRYRDDVNFNSALLNRKRFQYGFRWYQAGEWLVDLMGTDPRAGETYSLSNLSIQKVYNIDTYNPTYYIRLAEMYLIKSEGLARSGASLEEAKAPLEEIRSRAFGSPQISAATTIPELLDEIYTEIVLELSFEHGAEWFAGIRFDKIIDNKPTVTSIDQYILPIPQSEIDANGALSIGDQNPGYTQ
ncbi:RagB/SusD family nutrient uptake outer membrane protein [Fulvivirga sp. M361]|uniref:RagB/SusD family nutrient uptake outer membrane protein n=1 Tax=Fulvivirga sp. M361 TaxID=2594266 RepID=UPI001179988C|nr:RagB/SusD family nutrient uptake outer membrane protein [Fulvivirga sp. M361]TRX61819.1 RagB/SusD family nutrient uptake outer membrane protein [Fulvivirga sp. M361]